METKALLYAIVGFLLGGFVVSTAAVTIYKPAEGQSHQTSALQSKTGDDFDKAFIEEMIVHHQGAIDMATLADTNARHTEIKQLSSAIVAAQQREIDQMKAWQEAWGYNQTSEPEPGQSHP